MNKSCYDGLKEVSLLIFPLVLGKKSLGHKNLHTISFQLQLTFWKLVVCTVRAALCNCPVLQENRFPVNSLQSNSQ